MVTKTKETKKTNLKRTTIFLTEEHHEMLRKMAFEKRTSMANLIREAVLELIEDDEDIREILKQRAKGDEGSISWEDYKKERLEREKRNELSRHT